VLQFINKYHVSKLGIFHATADEAFKIRWLCSTATNSHLILLIDALPLGLPSIVPIWLSVCILLTATISISCIQRKSLPLEKYCSFKLELQFLVLTTKESSAKTKHDNSTAIAGLKLRYYAVVFNNMFEDVVADA
jgi:hypothetical protein